jgi:hypothetical protein
MWKSFEVETISPYGGLSTDSAATVFKTLNHSLPGRLCYCTIVE